MDVWRFLMELVMLLGGAFVFGALARRLRQSPIVGYLVAGTVIGPLLFNAQLVNQTAELGVALLLFSIGLEFSFARLRRMGRMALGGGGVQVAGTLVIVALLLAWPLGMAPALTMAAIVSLSSTAVVMRVLVDRAEVDSVRGRTSLAILLFQDIAIVPLVLMVTLLAPSAADLNMVRHIVRIAGAALGLAAVLYGLLYHLVPRLLRADGLFADRELSVLLALAVGLGAAWAAHAMGISPALGAFVAGMLLAESPFATQIRADIGAIRTVMVTLFFASVGMLAQPLWFVTHLHWVVLIAVSIVCLKILVIFIVCRIFGLERRQALATGVTLSQVGEFSFVLASEASSGGILGAYSFNLIVSVIILLIFAAPYMVAGAYPLADRLGFLFRRPNRWVPAEEPQSVDSRSKVLVVGFGPAGRQVVEALSSAGLVPVVLDINPQSVAAGRSMGVEVHLGDAAHEDVLIHARLADMCMAVVTVPDTRTAVAIVELIRRLRPTLAVAVRCRYNRHLPEFEKAGADMIADEEIGTGKVLAQHLLSFLQERSGQVVACRLAGQEPEVVS